MVAAAGVRDIYQSISDPQFQGIVGVVLKHENVDDVEEGLAERQEEKDGSCDVIEVLSDDVGSPAVDKFDNRAHPFHGCAGLRGVILEQPEGCVWSWRNFVEFDDVAEDIGNISQKGIISCIFISVYI